MSGNSGATAQDKTWKVKEQSDEAQYIYKKEQAQLAVLREQANKTDAITNTVAKRNIEGGFGGLEDLEDRYATTSGEH